MGVIVKVKNATAGAPDHEVELHSEEHAAIFREILALREKSGAIEGRLAGMGIVNDPYRDIEIKLSMILDELWPDTTPEGQLTQLGFERRFQEAKLAALEEGQKHANSILIRGNANGASGLFKPGG